MIELTGPLARLSRSTRPWQRKVYFATWFIALRSVLS